MNKKPPREKNSRGDFFSDRGRAANVSGRLPARIFKRPIPVLACFVSNGKIPLLNRPVFVI